VLKGPHMQPYWHIPCRFLLRLLRLSHNAILLLKKFVESDGIVREKKEKYAYLNKSKREHRNSNYSEDG
jgi:hypothetical protein